MKTYSWKEWTVVIVAVLTLLGVFALCSAGIGTLIMSLTP